MKGIEKELGGSTGKKRGPDSTVSKTFKRFVQTADDERRSGALQHHSSQPAITDVLLPAFAGHCCCAGLACKKPRDHLLSGSQPRKKDHVCDGHADKGRMLGRRAAKLLAHVQDALQWVGLSSTMCMD